MNAAACGLSAMCRPSAGHMHNLRWVAALHLRRSAIRDLLCDEAGFLAETRVRGALDEAAATSGALSLRIEAVVKALGVTDATDFDTLVARLTDGSPDVSVDPDAVVARLQLFVEEELRSLPSRSRHTSLVPTSRALRRDIYAHEFWERMSSVVSSKMCRIWSALDSAMQKHNTLLEQRSAALAEMQSLAQQNQELRGLLDTYRSSKQAAALIIPPNE